MLGVGLLGFFDGSSIHLLADLPPSTRLAAEGLSDYILTHMKSGDLDAVAEPDFQTRYTTQPLAFTAERAFARHVAARGIWDRLPSTSRRTHVGCTRPEFLDLSIPPRHRLTEDQECTREIRPGMLRYFQTEEDAEDIVDDTADHGTSSEDSTEDEAGSDLEDEDKSTATSKDASLLSDDSSHRSSARPPTRAPGTSKRPPASSTPSPKKIVKRTKTMRDFGSPTLASTLHSERPGEMFSAGTRLVEQAIYKILLGMSMVREAEERAGSDRTIFDGKRIPSGFQGLEDMFAFARDPQDQVATALRASRSMSPGAVAADAGSRGALQSVRATQPVASGSGASRPKTG